jgi:methionine biosynthesis protein MetW
MAMKADSVWDLPREASRYEYVIPDYEQHRDPYSRTWTLLEWIGRGKRVLELGCATGFMSRYLVQRRGCSVVGIEVDPKAAAEAKAYCSDVLVEDLNSSNWVTRLSDRSFDVAVMGDVLEHLVIPERVLTNLYPLLAKEGRLVISLPNIVHWLTRLKILFGQFNYEPYGILDHTHLRFYTPKTARHIIEGCGYEVTRFHAVPGGRLSGHGRPVWQWLAQRAPNLFAYQMLFEARKKSSPET